MRARLALASSQQGVELREVVLRDKPEEFLAASPSATVPCLVHCESILDESLDVMVWALERNDPEGWLDMPEAGWNLIERCDGPFKSALDRTKYATRYIDSDPLEQRSLAIEYLSDLDAQIGDWLFESPSIADFAILPFVRQFAFIDKAWFDTQPWPKLKPWLESFIASDRFSSIMQKYPKWTPGDEPTCFPS